MHVFTNKNRTVARHVLLSVMLPFVLDDAAFDKAAIYAQADAISVADSGTFSVITYNVAGLPQMISSAATNRDVSTPEIGRKLNGFDVAHVQEDFNYNDLLCGMSQHPYRTISKGKVLFGDGLNTFSRFPIREVRRVKWDDCTGADCFTPKGFSYSQLEVAAGVFIDFYNVHANAYNHRSAAAARRKNMIQLSDFIKKHSPGNAVVIMGDLNGRYGFDQDNIGLLHESTGMEDAWVKLKKQGIFPNASAETPPSDIMSSGDSSETIDKILYRSSSSIQLNVSDYRLEKLLFSNAGGQPLSDHHPVSAKLTWKVLPERYVSKRNQ